MTQTPSQPLRVVQFSTGHVGEHSLRHIIESPHLELVGLHASNPTKIGRDAAELCGLDAPTGVVATDDRDALVALGADCVLYTAQGETRPPEVLEDLTAFLAAGTNVVSTALIWLIHPAHGEAWLREPLEAACREGGATMLVTGIDPGFSGDVLPLAAMRLSQRVDKVTVQEIFDYATYDDAEFTGVTFGFGQPADAEPPVLFWPGVLASTWGGLVHGLADALGVEVEELRESHDTWVTPERIDCAMMTVEPGHVAAIRFGVEGLVGGEPVIVMEHVNRLTEAAAPDWPYPPAGHPGVHRVLVEGRPGIEVNVHLEPGGDTNLGGIVATAATAVNAVPAVCAAAPGLIGQQDLPLAQAQGLMRGPMRG